MSKLSSGQAEAKLSPQPLTHFYLDDELLAPSLVAEILGVSIETLAVWRCTGRHSLPFLKIGHRVRYRRNALEAWLDDRTRANGATA